MSDVMKQVVQEIMQRNKTIVSHGVDTKTSGATPALTNIKRPNYQRLKQEERLRFTKNSQPTRPHPTSSESKKRTSPLRKQFNEESISALSSLALVQGNLPKRNARMPSRNQMAEDKARIIGKTRNGGMVWFFPKPNEELRNHFSRPLNREAVGVVRMPECLPSQLLLIDEVIQEHPEVKFSVTWEKNLATSFTVELFADDAERLEKIMHDVYQRLNRRSLKAFETYTVSSPSAWLKSQLKLNQSAEGIAILEGIPYYTSILLMDHLLKDYETSDFQFVMEQNYLLLFGNYDVISKMINELKKEAGQFVSSG